MTVNDAVDWSACLLRDRPTLQRDLAAAQARAAAGRPYDRLWARFAATYEKSTASVQQRRAALPDIQYPADLPISTSLALLRETLTNHQVVVLAGETGSGKTTQLPKLCLEIGRGITGLIGHTQPRRLAARTVAARIASELRVRNGEQVGYAVRFSENVGELTLIKLMTDGILLNDIARDPLLLDYDTLILDEAHERSLNIDFLIGYLKALLPRRPDLKLIITSATIDVARFAAHFDDAPVVVVSGRGYPVDMVYLPPATDDAGETETLEAQIVDVYSRIIADERQHGGARSAPDVLVFLSGERDILEVAQALRKAQLPEAPEVLPLYARLPASEQDRVFNPGPRRRIVLATNVAETSLTVPRIGYVIDPGLARISRYSYRSKLQRLPVEPISQASAEQRSGRCGRVAPGVCFRLYSEEDFQSRPAYTDAEILRTNLASVVLQMKLLGLGEVGAFPFLDPPEPRAISDALTLLGELGAVLEGELTERGRRMARLPVDPRLARMLLAAVDAACVPEVLIIASALAVQDPRERPLDKQQAADASHKEFVDPDSDFVSYLHLWQWYEAQRQALSRNQLRKLCVQRHLAPMRMQEWRDLHRQLTLALHDQGVRIGASGVLESTRDRVHQALLTGSLSLIGMRQERFDYLGARGQHFFLFPGSALFKRRPPWVMASEIVETQRVYARTLAAIDPAWLEVAGGPLVKRQYSEPHWSRKRGEVAANERVTLYGLPIVERRRVSFGRIDPLAARDILLRAALIAGDVERPPAFLQHNLALVAAIADDEARLRRRDFLVDEQAIYDFYDARIPADVVDMRSLERFRRHLEATQPQALFLTRADLLSREVTVDADDFPMRLALDKVEFQLKYRFAPGEADDGVALQVPVGLLPHLRAPLLQWLVPGYLELLCEALIRGLPRSLRRDLVPLPELLATLVPQLRAPAQHRERALPVLLSETLRRLRNVEIPVDAWRDDDVPTHLRMLIEVRGDNGELLARDRALEPLRAQFKLSGGQGELQRLRDEYECASVASFPEHGVPERRVVMAGDRSAVGFPALVMERDEIALRLFDDAGAAARAHSAGVVVLAWRQLGKLARQMLRGYAGHDVAALRYAAFGRGGGGADAGNLIGGLEAQLRTAVVGELLGEPASCVREQGTFNALVGRLRREGAAQISTIGANVFAVLEERYALISALQAQRSPAFAAAEADIQTQLAWLVPADFIAKHGAPRLPDIARYVRAARARWQNLQGKVTRDASITAAIQELERRTARQQERQVDAAAVQLRWELQELRVVEFAPGVKAQVRTSLTRARRQLEMLEAG